MSTHILHRIDRVLADLGESGADALLANGTLIQYCVQDMFKGRQIPTIAKNVAKKFNGVENMFLGPGVIQIDPKELEAALWKYVAQDIASAGQSYKAGKEHFAIDGVMHKFRVATKYRAKLKALAIAEIGRDIFTSDVSESGSSEIALTFKDKRSRNRADDAVLTEFPDAVQAGQLETRHTEPTVLYVSGTKAEVAITYLSRRKFSFTRSTSEGVNWHQTFNDGFVSGLTGVNEMAATYVPITRDEFEAWLTEVWGSGNWNIRSGSVGVYRLKLGPKVSLEVSSSIGRADTNMGVGEGAIHVAMVGRVTGRTLNRKATGKSRINRTKGWKGNLLAALKALEAAYRESPAFYESIADPAGYRDETLARIASIPGSDADVFWSSLRDQVSAGRVLSDKQTAVLMRRTPDFKYTGRTATPPSSRSTDVARIARSQRRGYLRDIGMEGGGVSDFGV